ncbi:contractile injection system tape measure protein [Tenacibaculum xiamenense]|uniref:contractile injection system tape measure protein n=1 Tax=Tenacibaculum xiamenense TaxID=1261553 RepID=UPI003893EC53
MMNTNQHIVAKCSWNTSFDDKERGTELQNNISTWCQHHFQEVLTEVFDEVCPKEKTFRIKRLELNLGEIDYHNFYEDLADKVKRELYKNLENIVQYPYKYRQGVEIINEKTSHVRALEYFLLNGVMPWNYQAKYGNINQIISIQWQLNKEEVVQMLQLIGKNEHVRKRIAWQFEERNIMTLIQNIEQSNHKYIKDVTGELIKIQEKENIIQAGIQDFKRNIWFWILNYLFIERGTMFNKYAFVKSAIKQMASHFNIEYNELLEIIEEAVNRVKSQYFIKTEFIAIIQELSKEQLTGNIKSNTTEKQFEYYWELLTNQFNNHTLRSSAIQKKEFNDLIINLKNQNESRFKKLIESLLANDIQYWEYVLQDLELRTISEIVRVVNRDFNGLCTQISYIESLKLSEKLKLSSRVLWTIGFMYARKFLHSNKETFLTYLIQDTSKRTNSKEIDVIDAFWVSQVSSMQKHVKNLTIYNAIKTAYMEKTYSSDRKNSISIVSIVDQLYLMLQSRKFDVEFIDRLKESFEYYIENRPYEVINLLKENRSKRVLMVTTSLIDEVLVEKLIAKAVPSYKKIITIVDTIFVDFEIEGETTRGLHRETKVLLNKLLLNTISEGKQLSNFEIFKQFIGKLTRINSIRKNQQSFYKEIINGSNYVGLGFSSQQVFEIENWANQQFKVSHIDHIIEMIHKKESKREVVEFLKKFLLTTDGAYVFLEKYSDIIINYFLNREKEVKDELIKEYTNKINVVYKNESTETVAKILLALFWNCLMRVQEYSGDKTKLQDLFRHGVLKRFPLVNKEIQEKELNTAEYYNNPFLERSRVEKVVDVMFTYLESKENESDFIVNKIKHSPEHAIIWSLEMDSDRVFLKIRNSKNPIDVKNKFKKRLGFDQFTQLLLHSSKQPIEVNNHLEGILNYYRICREFIQSKRFTDLFWNELFEIITKNTYLDESFIQFVSRVILEIQKSKKINSKDILSVIHDKKIKVSELLLKALAKQKSEFEEVLQVTKENSEKSLKNFDEKQLKEALVNVIELQQLPYWFHYKRTSSFEVFINDIIECRPLVFLRVLRSKMYSRIKLQEVIHALKFSQFIKSLTNLYPERRRQLLIIEKFYKAIRNVSLKKTPVYQIQNLITEMVLKAWITVNWKQIDTITIWNELVWELTTRKRISEEEFFKAFDKIKENIPVALQLTYESIQENEKKEKRIKVKTEQKQKMKIEHKNEVIKTISVGVPVKNAGMVLINSYFSMLLERLNLVKNSSFISDEAQQKAAHYLQYLVTGLESTDEYDLPLNKIFCGIPLHTPIIAGIDVSEEETQLINGLIHSCINYWSAIGSCSVNGFRGNWLVRDGLLMEEEDRWQLTVEHRPYDVLMLKSPFSFSIIKLPWMKKPLHVTWPF